MPDDSEKSLPGWSDEPPGWTQEVGGRLKLVVTAIGGNKSAGRIAGVSDEMISRYLNGRARPTFGAIAALVVAAGKSLDWLATGVERSPAQDFTPPTIIDAELLGRVTELVMRTHEEVGSTLPKQRIGQIAARVYSQLAAAPASPEGREGQFNLLKTQLRDEILSAYKEPGKGKVSA